MSSDVASLKAQVAAQEYVVVRLLAEIARRSPDGWDIVADILVGAEQQNLNAENQVVTSRPEKRVEARYFRSIAKKLNDALGRPVEQPCRVKGHDSLRV